MSDLSKKSVINEWELAISASTETGGCFAGPDVCCEASFFFSEQDEKESVIDTKFRKNKNETYFKHLNQKEINFTLLLLTRLRPLIVLRAYQDEHHRQSSI